MPASLDTAASVAGIGAMTAEDYPAVAAIFAQGIATGNASLETAPPSWEEWDSKHVPECRLAARTAAGAVAGWAALSAVSSRCVYKGVAEVSVYVGETFQGQGLGQRLLQQLVADSEKAGFWTLQAGILPENKASVRLHKKCGFRVVGVREKLGQLNGQWRDVLLLERRSKVAGV